MSAPLLPPRSGRRRRLAAGSLAVLWFTVPLAACSIVDRYYTQDSSEASDAGDGATDAPADAWVDAPVAPLFDVSPDTSLDAPDTALDAPADTRLDGPVDAPIEASEAATEGLTITPSVSRLNIVSGGTASLVVNVTRNGFAGPVTVSLSNLPSGVSANPITLTLGEVTGTLTLQADANAAVGAETLASIAASAKVPPVFSTASVDVMVQGPAGTLDSTFGTGGVATFTIPDATKSGVGAHGLAVQADGAIVATGSAGSANTNALLVARVIADGGLDNNFAANGFYVSNVGDTLARILVFEVGQVVKVLPSGALLVGGWCISLLETTSVYQFFLAELSPAGTPVLSFGQEGAVAIDIGTAIQAEAFDVALRPDGGFVLAGSEGPGGAALAGLTAEGQEDPSFGASVDGISVYPVGANSINALVPLPSGALVASLVAGPDASVVGARFTGAGALDDAFAEGGVLSVPGLSGANTVVVQPSGEAVYVATGTSAIQTMRATTSGQLDLGFGTTDSGIVATPIPNGAAVRVDSAIVMPDGRIVVAALFGTSEIGLVRFLPNGALDPDFAQGGFATIPDSDVAGGTEALALDAAGRIVLAAADKGKLSIFRFWP